MAKHPNIDWLMNTADGQLTVYRVALLWLVGIAAAGSVTNSAVAAYVMIGMGVGAGALGGYVIERLADHRGDDG